MTPKDKQDIQKMEELYDGFKPKLDHLRQSLASFKEDYHHYNQLMAFYGSEDWFRLRDLPAEGIKSGVLSEDQLFDLVTDHKDLLGELLALAYQMHQDR